MVAKRKKETDEKGLAPSKSVVNGGVEEILVDEDQLAQYQDDGKLVGYNPKTGMAKVIMAIFAAMFLFSSVAFSATVTVNSTDEAVLGVDRCRVDSSGDLICANEIQADGDVLFQSSLYAVGRKGGASTASSSSTGIAPSTIPYSILYKRVGGVDGLDMIGEGTNLPNGTSGQVLTLFVIGIQDTGNSEWRITPTTSSTIDRITLDAVGDYITLVYVDDTFGWQHVSNYGAEIDFDVQGLFPEN